MIIFLFSSKSFADEDVDSWNNLTIYVPSSKGGGADMAAIAIKDVLEAEGLVGEVRLVRSGGAGGLISLAQFLETQEGNGSAIFLGSRTSMGASIFNRSDLSLLDTRPLARLIGPTTIIAVKSDSNIGDLQALLTAYRRQPTALKWVGGSGGGQDELVLLELSRSLGVSRADINYHDIPGGGPVIAEHLVSDKSNIMIESFEESQDVLARDLIRIIMVIPQNRSEQFNIQSQIQDKLVLPSPEWRGVFAPKGLSNRDIQKLETLFQTMNDSPAWQQKRLEYKWDDIFLTGAEFDAFIQSQANSIQDLHDNYPLVGASEATISDIIWREYRWLVWAGLVIAGLLVAIILQRFRGRSREKYLAQSLESAEEELERKLDGSRNHINQKFSGWKLTESENEIGWLLLKGLSFKEIADARGTSERTVRQQARSIYAKSGLTNRSDLSAFFLEDFVFGKN